MKVIHARLSVKVLEDEGTVRLVSEWDVYSDTNHAALLACIKHGKSPMGYLRREGKLMIEL